jgi:CheY-like chemotaxis protein
MSIGSTSKEMIQKEENRLMSKTMLIIEDDVVTRDLLRLVFEYDGFTCMEAENGAMGLAML